MNKKIKREKGQEKKKRKLGGISALDYIVYGGKPVVYQRTLNSETCQDHFPALWLRNKMKKISLLH